MPAESVAINRPQRWDHPLDPSITPAHVAWLLTQPPFRTMNRDGFAQNASLPDILKNDTRLHKLQTGDVVFQKGQYGGSAYLVMQGQVRICVGDSISTINDSTAVNRGETKPQRGWRAADWLGWFYQSPGRSSRSGLRFEVRGQGASARLNLQDVPGVLDDHNSTIVTSGELFGELAAVTRTAREFSAVADGESLLLEIRWQGLRLLRQNAEFRSMLDERYRAQSLRSQLQETDFIANLPEADLDAVVASARLESFGDLEWYADFKNESELKPAERIAREPLIAEEGTYAAALWIVRSGFARLSRKEGVGHRTLAYLGKGHSFGWRELAHSYQEGSEINSLPYQESLRAIGYVDAVCIPKGTVLKHILPHIPNGRLPERIASPRYRFGQPVLDAPPANSSHQLETGLLEFLVDQRLINGQQTMVIDTQRCTRCDDCVRACAAAHDDVALFERRGEQYGPWLFAQACMHCEDPVCMIGCPTGAIHRDESTGLVQIYSQTCIGCKTCAESCPYENIRMMPTTDRHGRQQVDRQGLPILQATKCDLCQSRGGRPACQSACPHDALVRMDMSDLKGISRWLQSKGT